MTQREWDESKHPREPAGSSTGGEFAGGGGGGEGDGAASKNTYGLVPGDLEKFHALKDEWSKINNELLGIPDAAGMEATAKLFQQEAIVKEWHTLHADPGGPGGIGLPGGPRDVVIVGAGPGGLSAGINAGADGLDALLIEGESRAGGQAKFSSRVENYGGFPVGISGDRLMQDMHAQSQRLGTESLLGVRVTGMAFDESTGLKHLTLSNGDSVEARTVILAGGLYFRDLDPFPGKEGPGIVIADNEKLQAAVKVIGASGSVCVIGGSNGAGQAALEASRHCDHVYVLARSPIVDGMSDYVVSGLKNNPKITVIENDQIAKLWRDEHGNPEKMETKGGQTLPVKAIGAWIGGLPDTKWMPKDVQLAGANKIQTSENFEVNKKSLPGVWAVGDITMDGAGRVGAAYGDGQLALRNANNFLLKQKKAFEETNKEKAAAKPTKPKKVIKEKDIAALDKLVSRLFDLDRANPWWAQKVEPPENEPPEKKGFVYLSMAEAATALDADTFERYSETVLAFLATHPRIKHSDVMVAVRPHELLSARNLVYRTHEDALVQKQI